jgi:hypothetical protein
MLGSVVTSKAEHRRFPRIRKSRRVPIRDLALPAVVLNGSGPFVCRCATKGDELAPRSGHGRLPLCLSNGQPRGHDAGPLVEIVHSTSQAPAAPRARVAGGAEERLLARRIRSSKRGRQLPMQLDAVDGRTRDPGGSPFAYESGCACPRERRAVGARPSGKRSERLSWRLVGHKTQSAAMLAGRRSGWCTSSPGRRRFRWRQHLSRKFRGHGAATCVRLCWSRVA